MSNTLCFVVSAVLCCVSATAALTMNLLPQPNSVVEEAGFYTPSKEITLQTSADSFSLAQKTIDHATNQPLKSRIRIKAGVEPGWWVKIGNSTVPPAPTGNEAYRLDVTPTGIVVTASNEGGLRQGLRTLVQVLGHGDKIPACRIDDSPALSHRGLMIDMVRLKERDEVYFRLLEEMAAWKMNALYLHFTDNEGCSIELKSHPELVTRNPMSQETVKKLIARGAELGVRVIPEVEFWGHAFWITVPHPELAELGSDSLCLTNEAIYPLIDDIVKEVAAIFPDECIHIGCDEGTFGKDDKCKARVDSDGAPRLIADHINRVNAIVRKHGKTSVVWGDFVNWPKGLIALLDRNIIAEPWYYNPGMMTERVRQFTELGFTTIGAPALSCRGNKGCPGGVNLQNTRDWSFALKQEKAEGVASTVWATQRLVPRTLGPGIAWAANHAWNSGDPNMNDTMAAYLVQRFGLSPTADRVERLILLGETDDSLKTAFWPNAKALVASAAKADKRTPKDLQGLSAGLRSDAAAAKSNKPELKALALAADAGEHLAMRREVGRQVVSLIGQARADGTQATAKLTTAAGKIRAMEKDRVRLFELLQQAWDHDRYADDPQRAGRPGKSGLSTALDNWHIVNTLHWWFGHRDSYGYSIELADQLDDTAKDPSPKSLRQLPVTAPVSVSSEASGAQEPKPSFTAECIPSRVSIRQEVDLELRLCCSKALAVGDKVEVQFPNSWLCLTGPSFTRALQTQDANGEHHISVGCAAGQADFSVQIIPRQLNFPSGTNRHGRLIVATLAKGNVPAGESINVKYSNTIAPYIAETETVWVRVNGEGPKAIPTITTASGDAVATRVIAPSTALPGETFSVLVVSLDKFDNRSGTRFEDQTLTLDDGTTIAEKLTFTGSMSVPVSLKSEGVYRFRFGDTLSNPIRVVPGKERVYWGDMHIHTKLSHDGQGNTPYEYAREVSGLDFAAVADHVESLGEEGYAQLLRWATDAHVPNKFVSMLADERIPPITGHHNIYFRDVDAFQSEASRSGKRQISDAPDAKRVMLIPHHTGVSFRDLRAKGNSVDMGAWDDKGLRPVMEIYSHHGQSELYSPQHVLAYELNRMWNPERRANTSIPGPYYAQDYWMAGYRLGVIASSDEHSGQGGRRHGGIAAVLADDLTREDIFDSIRSRSCYATTGERILLEFDVNGQPMGSQLSMQKGKKALIALRVWATELLTRVEILRFRFGVDKGFQPILSVSPRPESRDASFRIEDEVAGPCVYYARITQEPLTRPGMAWTSPIWIDTP